MEYRAAVWRLKGRGLHRTHWHGSMHAQDAHALRWVPCVSVRGTALDSASCVPQRGLTNTFTFLACSLRARRRAAVPGAGPCHVCNPAGRNCHEAGPLLVLQLAQKQVRCRPGHQGRVQRQARCRLPSRSSSPTWPNTPSACPPPDPCSSMHDSQFLHQAASNRFT